MVHFRKQGHAQSLPKGKITIGNAVLFCTYSLLISKAKIANEDTDAVANTAAPRGSRLAQIVDWLKAAKGASPAEAGDCMIVLDECHKAKNLFATGKSACNS